MVEPPGAGPRDRIHRPAQSWRNLGHRTGFVHNHGDLALVPEAHYSFIRRPLRYVTPSCNYGHIS